MNHERDNSQISRLGYVGSKPPDRLSETTTELRGCAPLTSCHGPMLKQGMLAQGFTDVLDFG